MNQIGKHIRALRASKNMTQDALAEILFVSRQTVSNYETGRSQPDLDMLVRIAGALECDVNLLLYGPPVAEDRRREISRLAVAVGCCTALAVFFSVFGGALSAYTKETFKGIWLQLILRLSVPPVLFSLLGWSVLQAAGLTMRALPLRGTRRTVLRRVLLGVGVAYGVMILPYVVFYLIGGIQVALTGSASLSLPLPLWWSYGIIAAVKRAPGFLILYFLFGAGLWATKKTAP